MKTKTPAPQMQTKEVLLWAQRLEKQKGHLVCKRIFDVVVSLLILLVTCPFFLLLAIAIKIDSRGPSFTGRYEWSETAKISKFSNSGRWCRMQTKSVWR